MGFARFYQVLCLAALAGVAQAKEDGNGVEGASLDKSDPVEEIALMVESCVGVLGGNTLVVFPFPHADGIKSIEGALISERIVTLLSERAEVRVLERALLDKIMEELKLGAMGFVDPATSVRLGKLLNARGILTGTVTDLGEVIEVHTRLLNVETGEVVAAMEHRTRKTIKTFISPIWSEIDRIKVESPSFKVELWTDHDEKPTEVPAYRIGEFIRIHFVAERDCYVTIFDYTTSGSVHVLFPNSFARDNRVKRGREYVLPDAQAGFKIRVTGPPGIERLKLFATTKDIPLFEENYAQEAFRSVTEESYSVTRDLEAVIDSLEDNAWAESHVEVRIDQTLRSAPEEEKE